MIGTSHSLFWMFMPYTYLAVLTKWGEANNASPIYVAATDDLRVKTIFGKGMTATKFLKRLLGCLEDPGGVLDAIRAGPAEVRRDDVPPQSRRIASLHNST